MKSKFRLVPRVLAVAVFAITLMVTNVAGFSRMYLNTGIEQFKEGAYQDSINNFDTALLLNPFSKTGYLQRGYAYSKLGNFKQALADYNRALSLDYKSQEGLERRAEAHNKLGQLDKSIADYSALVQFGAHSYDLFAKRADAYFQGKHYDLAIADYDAAISMKRSNPELFFNRSYCYQQSGDYAKALSDIDDAIRLEDKPSFHIARGQCLLQMNKLSEAKKELDHAVLCNPTDSEALICRGNYYMARGLFPEAISDFSNAQHLNDRDTRAYMGLAQAHEANGDYKAASKDWERVEQLNPAQLAFTLTHRADIDMKNAHFRRAIEKLQSALALQPRQNGLYLKMAECYLHVGEARKGLDACSMAIAEAPGWAKAYALRAKYYADLKQEENSQNDFATAFKLEPKCFEAFLYKGATELGHGDFSEAIANLTAAVHVNNQSREAHDYLALALSMAESNSSLAEVTINPDRKNLNDEKKTDAAASQMTPTALLNAGFNELLTGNSNKAARLLVTAVRKEPNDPRPRKYLAYAYLNENKIQSALQQFLELQKLEYDTASDAITLANSLQQNGNVRDAVLVLQKSCEKHPADTSLVQKLADSMTAFEATDGKVTLVTKEGCRVENKAVEALRTSSTPKYAKQPPPEDSPESPNPNFHGAVIAKKSGDDFTSSITPSFVQLTGSHELAFRVW